MGRKRRIRRKAGKTNRGRRFPPEVLTASEVRHLMEACSPESTTGVRNRVLIATLYRAGLRIAEALSLLPKDVDLDAGTIRVLHGKGDYVARCTYVGSVSSSAGESREVA